MASSRWFGGVLVLAGCWGVGGRPVRDRVRAVQRLEASGRPLRLTLADGRMLVVAAGHPLADGRLPGALVIGDPAGGSQLASIERVRYRDGHSYDLVTETGRPYYASGIAIHSTMAATAEPAPRCGAL
jgi:alkylation response protein AidB-like acyl-CoA dehydrogenase